jgi:hypothetical protein
MSCAVSLPFPFPAGARPSDSLSRARPDGRAGWWGAGEARGGGGGAFLPPGGRQPPIRGGGGHSAPRAHEKGERARERASHPTLAEPPPVCGGHRIKQAFFQAPHTHLFLSTLEGTRE